MMDKPYNFGAFIDDLRKSRNISRENFIDEIISLRQYQRYVNSESSINNEKLLLLIDKLNMNFFDVHSLFLKASREESEAIGGVYLEITRNNLVLADKLLKKINSSKIQNIYSKTYYELCNILILKRSKRIPEGLAMDKLKKLINYPSCLNNEVINFVEFVAFIELSLYTSTNDDKKILDFLFKIIQKEQIVANASLKSYLPSIYSHISRKFGTLDEYEKALSISQIGIDWCLEYDSLNALSHLLFYKAISLYYLDRKDEALIASKKLFSLLLVEDKPKKTSEFSQSWESLFEMKATEL